MRQATFDRLEFFPLVLDAPTTATLACNRLRLADLIAQAQATFLEETGKTLTLSQAIEAIDAETETAQDSDYWRDEPLRTVRVRGIDENGDPETTTFTITFDGTHFAMTKWHDGQDIDGWNMAHSLAEVNEQLELFADAVRHVSRRRKEVRANARPRKARSPRKQGLKTALVELLAEA